MKKIYLKPETALQEMDCCELLVDSFKMNPEKVNTGQVLSRMYEDDWVEEESPKTIWDDDEE